MKSKAELRRLYDTDRAEFYRLTGAQGGKKHNKAQAEKIRKDGLFTMKEAADKIGIALPTLRQYITRRILLSPPMVKVGNVKMRLWNEEEISRARSILILRARDKRLADLGFKGDRNAAR